MADSTKNQVVVVGSTNIDLIMQVAELPAPGETVGDARFARAMGGKGANQALAASRSGADVTFVSTVGDDDFGRSARDAFAFEGIDVSLMMSCAEPTGTALIFVDQHGENCIGVAPGANARCDARHIARAREPLSTAAVVLMQLEIPIESVRAVLDIDTPAQVILNAAPMHDLVPADMGKLDTLIVNETELAQIVSRCICNQKPDKPLGNAAACRELHSLGVNHVVVTLGKEGVFLSCGERQSAWPGFEVEAVDTTGAGDTFCGALSARLALGEPLEDAVRYAQAAAALACTRLGAQTAIPTQSDVQAFLADSA